jgi:hypothetical protein
MAINHLQVQLIGNFMLGARTADAAVPAIVPTTESVPPAVARSSARRTA